MRRFLAAKIILLIAVICPYAHAAVINVPADFQTVQAGIDHAQAGDTVLVQPGIYEEILTIGCGLTLGGLSLTTGDPFYVDSTVIDGGGRNCVVSIAPNGGASVLINGFTVRNGNSGSDGGGIYASNANLVLEHMKIIDNTSHNQGGGIGGWNDQSGSLTLTDCELLRNSGGDGGAIHLYCDITMSRVLIANNRGGMGGGAELVCSGHVIRMDHVTFADNQAQYGGAFDILGFSRASVTNCIFYGNEAQADHAQLYLDSGQNPFEISYCDLEGDIQGIDNHGAQINQDAIMDRDPKFVLPDSGNYRLDIGSPCIDAGDPNADPDPDGSRADMGAFPYGPTFKAFIGGQVLDAETELPIPGASIIGHSSRRDFFISEESDSLGDWSERIETYRLDSLAAFFFKVTATGYLQDTSEIVVAMGDSVRIITRLLHSECVPGSDSIEVAIDSGGSAHIPLTIFNSGGNGPLTWQALGRSQGDAGFPAGSLRRSYAVRDTTHDERIEGAVLADDHFYLCGANGDNPNLIYVLDRNGTMVSSFRQCGNSHYGFKDLEWDGDLIWAAGEATIYGFTPDGEFSFSWDGPFNPTNNIARDSDHNLLWLSGTTTNIAAFDIDGNAMGQTLSRQGLRIYGMAYWSQDPDGYKLYILDEPGSSAPSRIYKMNTETGDTMLVQMIPHVEGSTGMNGLFITNQFDEYDSWVMLAVDNIAPANGGDQLKIFQLQPNNEWLTVAPGSGEVAAGGESQVETTVRTTGELGDYSFKPGAYEGEIVFTHDAEGGHTTIPVHLTVREPNSVRLEGDGTPSSFAITSIYPNPFNTTAIVRYVLQFGSPVKYRLFEVSGKLVRQVEVGEMGVGDHSLSVRAGDLPSGLYIIQIEAVQHLIQSKILLLK